MNDFHSPKLWGRRPQSFKVVGASCPQLPPPLRFPVPVRSCSGQGQFTLLTVLLHIFLTGITDEIVVLLTVNGVQKHLVGMGITGAGVT